MARWALLAVLGGLTVGALEGCTLNTDDASRYKDPIPQGSEVALAIPHGGGTTSGQSRAGLHIQTGGGGLGSPGSGGSAGYATYYEFTRTITDGVDLGTGAVLAIVWAIVNLPPTHVDAHSATWGPGQGDALDPNVWRFVATETGDHEYGYELDGRPRASTSEADWKSVVTGHGYGKERPEHRSGWFQLDYDAANALDVQRAYNSGTVKVTYDLRSMPTSIDVVIASNDGTGSTANVNVTHQADGGGGVDISGSLNADAASSGVLETVVEHSRYDHTGAGRADIQLKGGDVPASYGQVTASECWSSTFAATYYTDSVGWQPTAGDPSTCVFPAAK